jgi:hypothetical protein
MTVPRKSKTAEPEPLVVIGIDPGAHTGICQWDGEKILFEKTVKHEQSAALIRERYQPGMVVGIEQSKRSFIYARSKTNYRVMLKVARNIGENQAMARELIAFCEGMGARVVRLQPCGTKLKPLVFAEASGFEGRCSEHVRDAWVIANRTWGIVNQERKIAASE